MKGSTEDEGDFPAERVLDLLGELYRILLGYCKDEWKNGLDSIENYKTLVNLHLNDWWSSRGEWKDKMRSLVTNTPTRRTLGILANLLQDAFMSFRMRPLWIQAIVVCLYVFLARHAQRFVRQQLQRRRRRNRRNPKLSVKTGQSEILQGRTSLVYGAAGDLMDEEYLEDTASGGDSGSGGGGRGRFGTFDFFGINTTRTPKKRRTRKRSQSFGDDALFGMGGGSPRQRTRSVESLGNPSGAALVRPRTESMESLSDTLGGFFQAFKGYRENKPSPTNHRANGKRSKKKHQTIAASHEMDNNTSTTASISRYETKTPIPSEKQPLSQFRKERLGSMDIYYKPGKKRPSLSASDDDEPFKFASRASWESGFFEGQVQNDFENFGSNDNDKAQYLHDEFGIVTLSHKVEYHGPFRPILGCGSTFVPPPSYDVVVRQIGQHEIDLPLKRILKMDLLKGSLSVIEPTTSVSQNQKFDLVYDNIDELSIKFKEPLEGGILFLYKKGTPKHGPDWKEHTFESAHAAAQFQLDLLAYQVLGKALRHIFEALHLVHQGSLACDGQEFVLHDKRRGDGDGETTGKNTENSGSKLKNKTVETAHCVTWDDAMRAMSSIPTVRIALERLWLSHKRPNVIGSKVTKGAKNQSKIALEEEKFSGAELSLLKEDYIKKRLLLGPVDFYRLFVPTLPETAIPEGDFNNRGRMEQLLCWRKRVARASVLVRSYTRARLVVNRGWNLERELPPPGTSSARMGTLGDHGGDQITKRFAYDGNEDNHLRDVGAKNEIYEASVSRDVLCHVRPFDYLNHNENDNTLHNSRIGDNGERILETSERHSISANDYLSHKHFVLSPYQAYTYVESHYFKANDEMMGKNGPLHPSRDPIEMFPSLKNILVRHPDLDFFVDCLSNPEDKILIVHLHVRSLAKGIDPQFDNVMNRFSNASEESRKRKLYLMVQLGNRIGFSLLGWLFLKLLSLYFRFTETCRDSPMNLESTRDRYGFPGFRVGGLFKTYHFGGSLQTDPNKPSNYIGLTKCTASYYESFVGKIVLDHLQRHFFESTVDLTFVIEGERNDELPERALSSLRIVHVNPNKVSKDPRRYVSMVEGTDMKNSKRRPSSFSQLAQYSFKSVRSIVHSGLPLLSSEKNGQTIMNGRPLGVITEGDEDDTVGATPRHLILNERTIDARDTGIDLIIDILRSVVVPCRHKLGKIDPKSLKRLEDDIEETGIIVLSNVPILRLFHRSDIKRYLVHFDYDIRIASERLVETASWRGATFPIDKRRCRIELQNGQFFQQGFDKNNNPVFYFRNLCRGPWRGDSKAIILAVLYRLDKSLSELCKVNPYTKVTLIVLMGHAKRGARKKKNHDSQGESNISDNESGDFEIDDDSESERGSPEILELPSEEEIKVNTGNPRISPDEKWTCHTNKELLRELFETLIAHYPGRLSKVLVVKGRGRNHYYRDQIQGKALLRSLLSGVDKEIYQQLMTKVQFVHKTSGLTQHVALKNLPTIVGGIAPIDPSAYEFYQHQS